jgi:RNA-directed DNA polymerase
VGEGDGWGVDLDCEKGVERVNHAKLRSVVKQRVADRRVWPRLDRDLKAGVLTDEGLEARGEGTPPGGPVSPWRAKLRLDGLGQAWARRGSRGVR